MDIEQLRATVVVPTRHEASNIARCHAQLALALGDGADWELVFVDDSDDDTAQVIEALTHTDPRGRLCHRTPDNRAGGLGGAVVRGFALARGRVVVVMDGDLQHPPRVVPDLIAPIETGAADITVGSRYLGDGDSSGLDGRYRRLVSRASRLVTRRLLPSTRDTTDPMSGFFAIDHEVTAHASLHPDGYKILMEVLERGTWSRVVDVPYTFDERLSGESKSDAKQGLRFVRHALSLKRSGRSPDPTEPSRRPSDPDELKVLILTSEAPPVISGISKTVEMLQRGLEARGHAVDIISRQDFPRLIRREIRLSAFALFWPRVRKNLPAYDVVNLHGPVPTMSETFLLLARTMGRTERPAIVYTHHSDIAIPRLDRWCRVYNRLSKSVAHRADAVVVSSEAYQSKIGRPDGKPVEVIPWAVETPAVEPSERSAGERDLRVLFVGQLRGYKGVNVLIDAVAQLPQVQLTIVGDGPLRGELTQQVSDSGADNITMAGRLSDGDLVEAYADHDVITLCSLTGAEAYGMVLTEGMSMGCVPVASDLPGVAEVAEPSGLVVPTGSVDGLREALATLDRDRELLAGLSKESIRRTHLLTVDDMSLSYERVFRDTVDTRATQRAKLAVPERWSGPEEIAQALEENLPVSNVSVALVTREARRSYVRVWSHGEQVAASDQHVSRYAFSFDGPAVVGSPDELDNDARLLLDETEATSAIFIPLRRTRRTVSLIGLSTTGNGRRLSASDLSHAMSVLHGMPRRRAAA